MSKDALADRRLNPLVDRYVTTDLSLLEIARTASSEHPLVRALTMLQECLQGKRLARDAIAAAREVQIKGSDPELMILMLSSWAELSSYIGRPTETEALVQRAQSMVAGSTHALVQAYALLAEVTLADVRGNKARAEDILRRLLTIVPDHSPRRKFYVWELGLFLSRQGRGIEYTREIQTLTWQCNEHFDIARILMVQFVNAVETGNIREASSLMPRIATTSAVNRPLRRIPYRGYQLLLRLMHDEAEASPPFLNEPATPDWIRVVDRLLHRDTTRALALARQQINRMLTSIMGNGFDSFSLVRAELAAGHAEAARHLLTMRQSRGNRHYLDEFFLARANMLDDNPTSAAANFAHVLQSVDYYQARGRLDLELRLACELSHGDVLQLTHAAAQVQAPSAAPGRPLPGARTALPSDTGAAAPAQEPVDAPLAGKQALRAIIGRSPATQTIRATIQQFANLDAPVLITGETGTGKELVARTLHKVSQRSGRPFTPVNCSSITETLLESELFGYERGAFTGAERTTQGLFEATGEGMIFLDEIGDISPRLQQALLRVLETGEFRPVGSTKTRTIACRILAATNADLAQRAQTGAFRRDLLYRLERLVIPIPPLHERPADILPLVRHFLDIGRRMGVHASIAPALVEAIKEHDWPGNIRELKNVVERMRLMHSDKLAYGLDDLDLKLQTSAAARSTGLSSPPAARAADAAPEREPDAGDTPPAAQVGGAAGNIDAFLHGGRSQLRRLDRLRELFREHRKLTRGEIIQIMSVSPNTASKDLRTLVEEKVIRRIEPSASTRSHYFVLAASDAAAGRP